MIFSSVIISALFVGSILAAPRNTPILAQRSTSFQTFKSNEANKDTEFSNIQRRSTYNNGAAGGVVHVPSSQKFNNVFSTFIVPSLSIPAGGNDSNNYTADVMIGIDGPDNDCDSQLSLGVKLDIIKGVPTYTAWWKWAPADTNLLGADFPVSAGDTIAMGVTNAGGTTGVVHLENKTKQKTWSKAVTGAPALCGGTAWWIILVPSIPYVTYPFSNFKTLVITDTHAGTEKANFGAAQAGIWSIQQGNKDLTKVSITGETITIVDNV